MRKYNNEIIGAICLLAAGFFLSFGGLLIRLVDDATTMQVTSYRSITFSLVALIYILIKFFQPVSLLKKFNIFLKSFGGGALKLIHFFFIGCENSNV